MNLKSIATRLTKQGITFPVSVEQTAIGIPYQIPLFKIEFILHYSWLLKMPI